MARLKNHCGVILAGGLGTRLGHLTKVTNKHLLPVGRYPMIYHPLHKLVEIGIEDIMIVTGPEHVGDFTELLGSGSRHKCRLTYRVQDKPLGIAHALGLTKDFVGRRNVITLLGDNIFEDILTTIVTGTSQQQAVIAITKSDDAGRFGTLKYDVERPNTISEIIEKPSKPPSQFIVTGIYIYPPIVFDIIDTLGLSNRGEIEITDVNNRFLAIDMLQVQYLNGYWTDAGTYNTLQLANELTKDKKILGIVDE